MKAHRKTLTLMSNLETDLISLIRDYPLINVDQLCRLTGRPMQSVARSLLKLCKEKRPYINRNDNKESPNTPYVYAVTKVCSTRERNRRLSSRFVRAQRQRARA